MYNKEILQNYNTRLDTNNTSLDNILNVVSELPEIVEPKLQDKSVTITENGTQNIVADDGFDAMNSVSVTTNVPPDTSDATATANDIATGKTAYIASGLVEGTGTLESDEPLVKFTEFSKTGYPIKALINKAYSIAGDNRVPNYVLKGDTNNSSYGKHYFYDINHVDINPNANIDTIGNYAFSNLKNLQSVSIPNTVTKIDSNAFEKCTSLKTINLPDTVTSIGSSAFDGCTNLEMSKLPSELKGLSTYFFRDCKNVTFSEIPEGIVTTQMPNSCFSGCSKITISKLPSKTTSFYLSAFYNCTSITEFEFHENFTGFGSGNNFNSCTSLKVLKFKRTTPPQLGNVNNFTKCPLERIEVPVGCLEAYQTATNWTNYASLMVEV